MKILQLINSMSPGGAQRLLADLSIALAGMPGNEITVAVAKSVACSSDEQRLRNDPRIRFIDLGLGSDHSPSVIRLIRPLMRQADVTHAHLFPMGYYASAGKVATPLIYTEHSTLNRRRQRFLRPLERMVYRGFDLVACVSDAVRRSLSQWLGPGMDSRIVTVANGIDLTRFYPAAADEPESLPRKIVMVSRFSEAKDQDLLIKAFAQAGMNDFELVFAGSGPKLETCKSLALQLGLGDRCRFPGEVAQPEELMRQATIGVQMSRHEGFGLTAVELMGCGIPLIASDVAGMREICGGAAMMVPAGDADALAAALLRLRDDPLLRGGMRTKGLLHSRKYSISATAEAYMHHYRMLASGS